MDPGKSCSRFSVNGASEEAKTACNAAKSEECVWLTNTNTCLSMREAAKTCEAMNIDMYLEGDTCKMDTYKEEDEVL